MIETFIKKKRGDQISSIKGNTGWGVHYTEGPVGSILRDGSLLV